MYKRQHYSIDVILQQHSSAPSPLHSTHVPELMDREFLRKWIGRRVPMGLAFTISWFDSRAFSPSAVCQRDHTHNKKHIKQFMSDAFHEIDNVTLFKKDCVNQDGNQFEYLRN